MKKHRKAVVVGVGPEAGLGAALCKRFATEGYHVLIAGPTQAKIDHVAKVITQVGGLVTPVLTNTTCERDVIALFDCAMADDDTEPADLIVYNAGNNQPQDFRTMTADFFEETWRLTCFGGFLVGREAARRLMPQGHGTLIFTGATASLLGRPPFTAFASAKAGLRAIAQSMAREFGPHGIHVAHVVIDGGIDGERIHTRFPAFREARGLDGLLNLAAITDTYWHLHQQHRTTWSFEVDLRPYKEPF
jgi:NAD(P)-dependent dehydrogenase (short-subunit alcohol dehydrogenase family)